MPAAIYLHFFLESEKKKTEGGAAIENYETAFREIKEITGTSNIDVIVEDFIKGGNFSVIYVLMN